MLAQLIGKKILSTLAVAAIATTSSSTQAHNLQAVAGTQSSGDVLGYGIDENHQAVVIAWPAKAPKAVLVAIHGFGLHKWAFNELAQRLQQDGISTYALDVRGFGGWVTANKHSRLSFKETLSDLETVIAAIRQDAADTPIFLMGESMGGAIALNFAAEHQNLVQGVIASVPSNDRYQPIATDARIAVSYILNAGGTISVKHIVVEHASLKNSVRQTWENDRQAKLKVSLAELMRFNGFMKKALKTARQIDKVPVLVVQGEKDRLVKPSGTERLFNNIATSDKQLVEIGSGEHLTFEDGQFNESVIDQTEKWLAAHEAKAIVASN